MSCEQLGSRLCVINHLGCYLPGSNIAGVCFDLFAMEDMLKRAYFSLMLTSWKIKFAESGQILNNVNCKHQNLICFMTIQEALSKHSHGDQLSKRKAPRYSGGRGTGGHGCGGHRNYHCRGGSAGYSGQCQSYGGHSGNYYAPNQILQVMVVDKVVVSLILLVVTIMLPVLSGDGATILPVVLGDVKVKAVADLLFFLCQYNQGKEDPNQGYEEQCYANGEEKYYNAEQEQCYKEGQAEYEEQYQAKSREQEEEQPADAHWLDEFRI